jgi:hypothetical protein
MITDFLKELGGVEGHTGIPDIVRPAGRASDGHRLFETAR